MSSQVPLVAVDVGNARVKLGRFEPPWGGGLPEPVASVSVPGRPLGADRVARWLRESTPGRAAWWIGSVHRAAASGLLDWLRAHRPDDPVTLLAASDLPLGVSVPRPDMVGVDRLLDALAANRLRQPGHAAVVVDVGTAVTVDLVSAEGVFRGGAILPGLAMSARAMHEFTDLLPSVDVSDLADPPPPLGEATEPAMRSGLFWGTVGAIRELIARLAEGDRAEPDVFLTGGAGPAVAGLLGPAARHVPHLTLAGIALAAEGARR